MPEGSSTVVYNKFADSSLDELGQTAFKVSVEGGATFGAEKIFADVPDPAAEGSKLAVRNHEVFIDKVVQLLGP